LTRFCVLGYGRKNLDQQCAVASPSLRLPQFHLRAVVPHWQIAEYVESNDLALEPCWRDCRYAVTRGSQEKRRELADSKRSAAG